MSNNISISSLLNRKIGEIIKKDDKQRIGIGGFILECRVKDEVTYAAEIPDTRLEEGSTANEHIILKPLVLTLEGEVGDVILESQPAVDVFMKVNRTAGIITKYASPWTASQMGKLNSLALSARDAIGKIDSIIADGENLLDVVGYLPEAGLLGTAGNLLGMDFGQYDKKSASITEQFITNMKALFDSKTPFNVEAVGQVYENMFFTSLKFTKGNEDNGLKYTMALKEIRYQKTISVEMSEPADAVKEQVAGVVNKGYMNGDKATYMFTA